MRTVIRRLLSPVWNLYVDLTERVRQPPAGMIAFDKYRRVGAYHWRLLEKDPLYRRRVEAVAALVEPHFRCLDLGCGDGAYVGRIARLCERVVGVDGDPDAIRLAKRQLARQQIHNVELVRETFAAVDASRLGQFDLVFSMDCIEHLVNPAELLRLASRSARDGALVIVGTPLFVGEAHVSPYHVKEYRREELLEMLEEYFQLVQELFLPATVEGRPGTVDRFYVYVGRKRAKEGRDRAALSTDA